MTIYDRITSEIKDDQFYSNFPNDGRRFVAWYLRRVLLLDVHETKAAITDGPNDKQIDAIVVDDGEGRCVRIIQGKFVKPEAINAEPLREVISAWTRLKDLPSLQMECSGKLAERLEAARAALEEEEYQVHFELLTTGFFTEEAESDFAAFEAQMAGDDTLSATLTLVNEPVIDARLSEAENRDLPELVADIDLDPGRCLITQEGNYRVVLAMLPIAKCLKLPGIPDGKLFRRNVRQSLGINNRVNKAMRSTLADPVKAPYFFFFHNGITALCNKFALSPDNLKMTVYNLSVVNGCQSLSTIYSTSGKAAHNGGSVLFRFYEIPQADLSEAISINTNSQSPVKPRDLRSNDKAMIRVKKRYEKEVPGGFFVAKRGDPMPADKEQAKSVDAPDYARMVISWLCQRPNLASNEKRLFDELYKKIFQQELAPQSLLAMRLWLNEIDKHWAQLDLNDAIKAVKGAARFHMFFTVSQLFSCASRESDKVPLPAATMDALKHSTMILAQAKGCMNQALQSAIAQSQAAGKIFSPQNWLKSKGAVRDEQLVASTVVNVLQNMNTPELSPIVDSLKLDAKDFFFKWSADD